MSKRPWSRAIQCGVCDQANPRRWKRVVGRGFHLRTVAPTNPRRIGVWRRGSGKYLVDGGGDCGRTVDDRKAGTDLGCELLCVVGVISRGEHH